MWTKCKALVEIEKINDEAKFQVRHSWMSLFFTHSFFLVERELREGVRHPDTGANWPDFRSQFHYYSLGKPTSVPFCARRRGLS